MSTSSVWFNFLFTIRTKWAFEVVIRYPSLLENPRFLNILSEYISMSNWYQNFYFVFVIFEIDIPWANFQHRWSIYKVLFKNEKMVILFQDNNSDQRHLLFVAFKIYPLRSSVERLHFHKCLLQFYLIEIVLVQPRF